MARPAGIEPATPGLEGLCSIRLSYGRPSGLSHRRGARIGRGRGIRTPDILLPKQARYQTALYPADGTGHRSLAGFHGAPAQRKAGHCPFGRGRCQRARPRPPAHGYNARRAKVAELVDALDLGSSAARRAGSIPVTRTKRTICSLGYLV